MYIPMCEECTMRDCLCRGLFGYLCVCVCLRGYMLCVCVFVLPGCVWRCQAIWSAVWGAHYPLSSAVGSGVLSICPFFFSLSHPALNPSSHSLSLLSRSPSLVLSLSLSLTLFFFSSLLFYLSVFNLLIISELALFFVSLRSRQSSTLWSLSHLKRDPKIVFLRFFFQLQVYVFVYWSVPANKSSVRDR